MKKKEKRTYEAPVILPLGELARGLGAPCPNGSSANPCGPGIGAKSQKPPPCQTGGKGGLTCANGPQFTP